MEKTFHVQLLLLVLLIVHNNISPIQCFEIQSRNVFRIYGRKGLKITRSSVAQQNIKNDEDMLTSSSIISRDDNTLNNAFEALPEREKYDAVLTGLCAKVLDSSDNDYLALKEDGEGILSGPVELLEEMSKRRIKASPRAVSALVDAASKSANVWVVADIMSSCIRNKSLSNRFGSLQRRIKSSSSSSPQIPEDFRLKEVTSATLFLIWMSVAFIASKSVDQDDFLLTETDIIASSIASIAFSASLGVIVVDNFYDVSRTALSFFNKDLELPKVLPFSLGTGQMTGVITRGLLRLFSSNVVRDCECEAAAFYIAYVLGLPCFAFRPNALEAAILLFESVQPPSSLKSKFALSPLLSQPGIIKILMWIMAPVAIESMKHVQLISSDPREGIGFLKRIKQKCSSFDISLDEIKDVLGQYWDNEDKLVQCAYVQSYQLLSENKELVTKLTDRLSSGTATVGDCVAVLEDIY